MNKSKTILAGMSALVGTAASPAIAHGNSIDTIQLQEVNGPSQASSLPNLCKNPANCEKNPLPKNPVKPIDKNDPVLKNPTNKNAIFQEVKEALYCVQLIEGQITSEGILPVTKADVNYMASCLDLFAEKLLEQ